MKIIIRNDLGGYAANAPALSAIDGTELGKPFILLCGPNGAGKSALLRMMRAATGVYGDRQGRFGGQIGQPLDPALCGGDLGKLGAFRHAPFEGACMPKDAPGVVDVAALGWRGQPTWFFSSRSETSLIDATAFGDDMMHQANMLVGGGKRRSHGQLLRHSWHEAQQWALGLGEWPYPYFDGIPASARSMLDALGIETPSEERWLFLDEPETAVDADALASGLALLLTKAEIGKLRVFCASHSFLFPAGMADHANVQVIDLGTSTPWLDIQRFALSLAKSTEETTEVATAVEIGMLSSHLKEESRRKREADTEIKTAIGRMSARPKALLLKIAAADGPYVLQEDDRTATIDALDVRRLIQREGRGWNALKLTPLGRKVADYLLR